VSQLTLTIPDKLVDAIAAAVAEHLLPVLRTAGDGERWPEWMAIETAARYLDVSPQRLRKLVARRQIPFHQEDRGCRVLFRRSDLDEWMAEFRVPTRSEQPW
jgi:excisionase family DNA binding protein